MGHPVVAYRSDIYAPTTTTTEIYVARWTGSAWDTSFGAVGDPSSKTFDIVLNDQNVPIVSVVDSTNASGVFIWGGTSWAFTAGAGATNASLALDVNGSPVMLNSVTTNWVPGHLTNGTWLPVVSNPVPSSPTSSNPSLASDTDRLPVVAWYDPSQSPAGHRPGAMGRLGMGQPGRFRQRREFSELVCARANRRRTKRHLGWLGREPEDLRLDVELLNGACP